MQVAEKEREQERELAKQHKQEQRDKIERLRILVDLHKWNIAATADSYKSKNDEMEAELDEVNHTRKETEEKQLQAEEKARQKEEKAHAAIAAAEEAHTQAEDAQQQLNKDPAANMEKKFSNCSKNKQQQWQQHCHLQKVSSHPVVNY